MEYKRCNIIIPKRRKFKIIKHRAKNL